MDYFDSKDEGAVPRPHWGLQVTVPEFDGIVAKLRRENVAFVVPPSLRFEGMPREQFSYGDRVEFNSKDVENQDERAWSRDPT